jgi:hypothetical protein
VVSINAQDETTKVESVSASLRRCDSCNLSDVCPEFQVDHVCAFEFPVEIKTDSQWEAASQALLEMQFQRIAFARFAEEVEGGTINPKVGQEMDRWHKMLAAVKDLKAAPPPGQGAMSRLFGDVGTPEQIALDEGPMHAAEEEIFEAEIEEDAEDQPVDPRFADV